MITRKRLSIIILLNAIVLAAFGQQSYYTSIDGVNGGAALKTALYNIIKNHKQISYGSGSESTWGAFYTTDAAIENGQRRVLDMYSSEKRYFGSKGSAVSGMNIEHSVAKSWWGGTQNNAYCDLHHLNPSDQNANSRKSNYPLGELTSISWDNGVTFVGKANIDGTSQNAYEPCDEYKGDFARVFMYMFTCYQDLTWKYTWMNYEKSTYPTLKPWAVELLLKWHRQDPVSTKEVNRNNAVYEIQGNRNPFVDYPQLAEYVWGDSTSYVFHLNGDVETGTPDNGGNSNTDGWKEYINEDFNGTAMVFSTEETNGDFPWILNSSYKKAVATSYVNPNNYDAESWLISPALDFSKDSIARISFGYVIRYCETGKEKEYHQLLISRDYNGSVADATWEAVDFDAKVNSTNWDLTEVKELAIPEQYMGEKNVTVAFRYIGTKVKAGTFEVDDVVLEAMEGENGNGETPGGEDDNDTPGVFDGENFILVKDASLLTAGDSVIFVYTNIAMGAQVNNYRSKVDGVVINGETITGIPEGTQIVLLEKGRKPETFAFNVGDGYLAASSSSNNQVKTVETISDDASWAITIDGNALATIVSQGSHTRNTLQYNTGSPRFSCYTGNQKPINIYAKSKVETGIDSAECGERVYEVYSITGVYIRTATDAGSAVEGLERGMYIINGKKLLVR